MRVEDFDLPAPTPSTRMPPQDNATRTPLQSITFYHYTPAEATAVLSTTFTVGAAALTANGLIAAAVARHHKFHTSGYALLLSLSLAESIALLCRVVLALPTSLIYMLHGDQVSPAYASYLSTVGKVLLFSSQALAPHIFLIGYNRYCSVLRFQDYPRLFTRGRTSLALALCWVLAGCQAVPVLTNTFLYTYVPADVTWTSDGSPAARISGTVGYVIAAVVVVSVCVFYSRTIHRIRQMGLTRQRAGSVRYTIRNNRAEPAGQTPRHELRLLFQFATVTLLFVTAIIISVLFSLIFHPHEDITRVRLEVEGTAEVTGDGRTQRKIVHTLFNLIWTINYSANSFIYLAFNRDLRAAVRDTLELCCCCACSSLWNTHKVVTAQEPPHEPTADL